MKQSSSNTNRHKLMAMGKPIKAATGGTMDSKSGKYGMRKMPVANAFPKLKAEGGGMPMKDGKPAFMQKKMNMGGMAKYAGGGLADRRGRAMRPGAAKHNLPLIKSQNPYGKK